MAWLITVGSFRKCNRWKSRGTDLRIAVSVFLKNVIRAMAIDCTVCDIKWRLIIINRLSFCVYVNYLSLASQANCWMFLTRLWASDRKTTAQRFTRLVNFFKNVIWVKACEKKLITTWKMLLDCVFSCGQHFSDAKWMAYDVQRFVLHEAVV